MEEHTECSSTWNSQSFLNLAKSMVTQDTSSQDEKPTSQLSLVNPELELVEPMPVPVPMKMDRSECIEDPMTLAGLGSETKTKTEQPKVQPKMEALSDNKVDVDIEPDVKSNRVSVNLCSFIVSLSCCSKVDKKDL
jgi:hypothetical protein